MNKEKKSEKEVEITLDVTEEMDEMIKFVAKLHNVSYEDAVIMILSGNLAKQKPVNPPTRKEVEHMKKVAQKSFEKDCAESGIDGEEFTKALGKLKKQ